MILSEKYSHRDFCKLLISKPPLLCLLRLGSMWTTFTTTSTLKPPNVQREQSTPPHVSTETTEWVLPFDFELRQLNFAMVERWGRLRVLTCLWCFVCVRSCSHWLTVQSVTKRMEGILNKNPSHMFTVSTNRPSQRLVCFCLLWFQG